MTRSSKLTKSLTTAQMKFLRLLDEEEILTFTLESIKKFVDSEPETLNEIIENLVHKEFLSRIERGKYCRSTFRDENVIGTFITPDSAIAYWSALNLHGLTEQFSNTIFVQTTHRKSSKTIFGTPYHFIQINPHKKAGIKYNGYGNHKYPITDVEKTIIDCFDLPQYSGGYAELIQAFSQAELQAEKLIAYCEAIDNLAIIKRLGFLSEYLQKKGLIPFINYARGEINTAYNLFDPNGTATGAFNARWRLRLNISEEKISGIVNNYY